MCSCLPRRYVFLFNKRHVLFLNKNNYRSWPFHCWSHPIPLPMERPWDLSKDLVRTPSMERWAHLTTGPSGPHSPAPRGKKPSRNLEKNDLEVNGRWHWLSPGWCKQHRSGHCMCFQTFRSGLCMLGNCHLLLSSTIVHFMSLQQGYTPGMSFARCTVHIS